MSIRKKTESSHSHRSGKPELSDRQYHLQTAAHFAAGLALLLLASGCRTDRSLCSKIEVDSLKSKTQNFVNQVRKTYPNIGPAVVDLTTDPCESGKLYQINYESEQQKRKIETIAEGYPMLKGKLRYRNW